MKFYLDTEFIETDEDRLDNRLHLISIGVVAENGDEFYAVSMDVPWHRANAWVMENVHPHLDMSEVKPLGEIAEDLASFVQDRCDRAEFFAWFGAYDWVLLCQLFGGFRELPFGFPHHFNEVRSLTKWSDTLPPRPVNAHHALADAHWTRSVEQQVTSIALVQDQSSVTHQGEMK